MPVPQVVSRFASLFGYTVSQFQTPEKTNLSITFNNDYIRELIDHNRRLKQQLRSVRNKAKRRQAAIEALQELNHERSPWILELLDKANKWDVSQCVDCNSVESGDCGTFDPPSIRDLKRAV